MIFLGAKWLLRSKTIIQFQIAESQKEFILKKPGLYSICSLGGGYFHKLDIYELEISKKRNQQIIELKDTFPKWRFRKNLKMFIEYKQFKILEIGNYLITIKNQDYKTSNRPILIKESVNVFKRILGILFLVFGVNGSFWSFYLALNPTPFV